MNVAHCLAAIINAMWQFKCALDTCWGAGKQMFALQLHYDFCTINVIVIVCGIVIVIVVIISQSEVSNYSYRLAMC